MKIIEKSLKTAKIDREIAESGWILTIFLKILRGTTRVQTASREAHSRAQAESFRDKSPGG
jgi:hypothetical protein